MLSDAPAHIAILGIICRIPAEAMLATSCRSAWFGGSFSRLLGVSLNESDYWRMMAVELTFGEFEQTDYHDLILVEHIKPVVRWTEKRHPILIGLYVSQA